jgi:hypothetical protein
MKTITYKVGDEIRTENQTRSEAPAGVVCYTDENSVTICVRDSVDDLAVEMHRVATNEFKIKQAEIIRKRRLERRGRRRYAHPVTGNNGFSPPLAKRILP